MPVTTLVDSKDLRDHLDTPDWRIIDVRHELASPQSGQTAWQQAHIPGAVFLHMDQDLSGTKTGRNGRHPLPDKETFVAKLRLLGINTTTQIVVYDAQGCMMAARLWWMLRWVGHGAVAVLDGGLQTWQAQGLPMDAQTPEKRALGNLQITRTLAPSIDSHDILASLNASKRLIIDARAPDRFRGENETLDPVGGHIPGARNRFFKDNLSEDGCFKSPQVLQTAFSELMADRTPTDVVLQCGSGITACHNLLAMEIAGLHGASLYPGSWSEWCSDPSRPVARGL